MIFFKKKKNDLIRITKNTLTFTSFLIPLTLATKTNAMLKNSLRFITSTNLSNIGSTENPLIPIRSMDLKTAIGSLSENIYRSEIRHQKSQYNPPIIDKRLVDKSYSSSNNSFKILSWRSPGSPYTIPKSNVTSLIKTFEKSSSNTSSASASVSISSKSKVSSLIKIFEN